VENEPGKGLTFLFYNSLQLINKKMDANPQSENFTSDVINDIEFDNIFNLEEIQRFQDLFSKATGVASIITYPDGTPITNPSNFCRLCRDVIRKTEKGLANCYKSDAIIGQFSPSGATVCKCLSGGLWDAGASITVGGKHLANWLIGQVRSEELDLEPMLHYADEIGANKEDFLAALNDIPVMPVEQFQDLAKMLFELAKELSEKGYTNLQLKKQVNERDKAIKLLHEDEKKYSIIFENVHEVFFQSDLSGIFLEISPSIKYFSEFNKDELIGTSVYNIYDNPEEREILLNAIKKEGVLKDYELKLKTKTNEIRYGEISASLISDLEGKPSHIAGAIRDITVRKNAEEAQKNSEQKYRKLHESMMDGFVYIDMQGFIRDYNKSFKSILGYSDEELSFLSYQDITPEKWNDFELQIITEQVLIRGFSDIYEKEYQKKDGTIIPVEVHAFLIKNDAGENEGMWAIVRDITERKNAKEALIESGQQLLNIIDFLPDATFVIDNDSKVIAWNKAIEEMTGVQKQDIIGKGDHVYAIPFYGIKRNLFLDLINNNNEELNTPYSNVIRHGNSLHAEIFASALYEGKGAYISVLVAPLFNSKGERKGSIESVRDITDRKKAEKDLVKLEKAIYTSGEAIFLTDREGVFSFINPAFTALYGFSADEIVGKVTPRIIKSGVTDRSVYEYFWQTLLNGDEVKGELVNKKKDGTLINIDGSATPIIDEEKKIIGFLGIQRDITERKQVEELLREQSDAMEAAIDGLAISNAEQNFVYMNKSYAAIFGYDNAGELIGRSWRVLYDNEELQRFDREIYPEIRLKGYYQGRALGKKKDGTTFPQALSLTALENGGMISTMRDITELKQAEQELIAAKEKAEESDRLKTAFLNNISHEIRTPFNGILGFLSILQDNELTGSERDEYTSIINQSANRLMNTINDLVEISQIQAGQLKLTSQETNITQLTEELINRFKNEIEKPGLQFIIHNNLSPSVALIKTDSSKLKTILSNLIGNAIKFTKSGSIELAISLKGDFFEFSVKDTGIGIAKSKQPLIFERFNQIDSSNTRQYEGLGLGLSITKSYVEVLGGRIWLESEEGNGAAFYFTIPNSFQTEELVEKKNYDILIQKKDTVNRNKVLIVEDDQPSAYLLNIIAGKHFNTVLHAYSGVEAVDIYRSNPDIELILMDIRMPGMNGYEATRRIRQFNKEVIIIAQTAFALSDDRERALDAGCNDYISKPFTRSLLLRLIKKYFK
jgi:PAS domain S-box-containing protein